MTSTRTQTLQAPKECKSSWQPNGGRQQMDITPCCCATVGAAYQQAGLREARPRGGPSNTQARPAAASGRGSRPAARLVAPRCRCCLPALGHAASHHALGLQLLLVPLALLVQLLQGLALHLVLEVAAVSRRRAEQAGTQGQQQGTGLGGSSGSNADPLPNRAVGHAWRHACAARSLALMQVRSGTPCSRGVGLPQHCRFQPSLLPHLAGMAMGWLVWLERSLSFDRQL